MVEPATESYDERFQRETREVRKEAERVQRDIAEAAAEPMPSFEQDHLRLKRAIGHRGIANHVIVSTEQLMRKSNRRAFILRGQNKHEVLSCGRRLVFEYNDEGDMTEREVMRGEMILKLMKSSPVATVSSCKSKSKRKSNPEEEEAPALLLLLQASGKDLALCFPR